jgi:hypothetical protein
LLKRSPTQRWISPDASKGDGPNAVFGENTGAHAPRRINRSPAVWKADEFLLNAAPFQAGWSNCRWCSSA